MMQVTGRRGHCTAVLAVAAHSKGVVRAHAQSQKPGRVEAALHAPVWKRRPISGSRTVPNTSLCTLSHDTCPSPSDHSHLLGQAAHQVGQEGHCLDLAQLQVHMHSLQVVRYLGGLQACRQREQRRVLLAFRLQLSKLG